MLINPGIPTREYYINNLEVKFSDIPTSELIKCSKCNIITPRSLNVEHCEICGVCILEHDHHCQWIGKCVGKHNLIYFNCFLICSYAYIVMCFVTFLSFFKKLERINYKLQRK